MKRAALFLVCMATLLSPMAGAQDRSAAQHAPRFQVVTVGQHFSCALDYDGQAFCWGANYYGQLGARAGVEPCRGIRDVVSTCALLPVAVATTQRFTHLSAGLKHVCAVGTDGSVWCWGRNEAGQLGADASTSCSPRASARELEEFAPSRCSFEPVRVEGVPPARLVAAGQDFSCALTAEDDAVWCWGASAGATPRRLSGAERHMTLSAGYTNVCADTDDSRVACWSLYAGVSTVRWMTVPEGLGRTTTHGHSCAIGAETNLAYCWGYNASGALGTGSHRPHEDLATPAPVAGKRKFVRIAVSFLGTCAVEASHGELYCWGLAPGTPQPDRCASGSEFGGSHRCALTPQPVFAGRNFSSVAIAESHGCAIAATTNAWCWGANDFGQLGAGTTRAANDAPLVVGVRAAGGAFSPARWPAPSPATLFLAGLLAVLTFMGVRLLRMPRR